MFNLGSRSSVAPHNITETMKLLKQLYEIYSPSGSEKRLKKFIKYYINEHVPGCCIEADNTGNLYITKGKSETYPCVVAHLDQVQKTHSKDFRAVETKDIILGYSSSNKRQEGLGADDKNGIWVALKCLEKYDAIKLAFFVQEETGCVGSSKCDMDFFTDCRFVLQCDRRGGSDLITNASFTDLCSKEFLMAFDYGRFGYKTEQGMLTDVAALKDEGLEVSALNISCGYYEPHTDHEFTIKAELQNCLGLVQHIIETCTDVYPHIDEDNIYGYYGHWAYDEYDDLCDQIDNYLSYNPHASFEEVYETFKDYSFFGKPDIEDIYKACNRRNS